MEVYFYCSYEHSQKGFFMTRLVNGQLTPAQTVPDKVREFFSYDRFQVLWYDSCESKDRKLWKPQPDGMFFGLRNLRGEMADGRRCTANMLLIAPGDEMTELRPVALAILGDYPKFQRQFTGWLSVGGDSYELDTEAFGRWMKGCRQALRMDGVTQTKSKVTELLFRMARTEQPRLETDLLRLAVYTSGWKDLQQVMGRGVAWKIKHPCALTPDAFEKLFITEAPLWQPVEEK